MNIELAAAYWSLGELSGEELPKIATDALALGLDSPSLRILAGELKPAMLEARALFERALSELDISIPNRSDAVALLARDVARATIAGAITPYHGAANIGRLALMQSESSAEFLSIIGLASEYDDFSGSQCMSYYGEEYCRKVLCETEAKIVEEAKRLLQISESI